MKCFELRVMAVSAIALGMYLGSASAAQAKDAFVDPLDFPAAKVQDVEANPSMAVVAVGRRLLAVGMRGLISFSDDGGKSWRQAQVPLQSDLTAAYFATPNIGWAVGHDGVILRSDDAGASWQRQLDGRMAADSFKSFYQQRVDAGEQGLEPWLAEIERSFGREPVLPYLDVLFDGPLNGYAVGSFGNIAMTTDGGKSWQPGYEAIDNPRLLNLNAIRKIGTDIYIAGEQGSVFRLNRDSRRFELLETGYTGSFFGINGRDDELLAFGLRGAVYRSGDRGRSWQPLTIAEGAALTGSTLLPDGRLALSSIAGRLWVSSRDWTNFQPRMPAQRSLLTGLASLGDGQVVISGLGGLQLTDLSAAGSLSATDSQSHD